MRNKALDYAQKHTAEALTGLKTLLRIPSISTFPEYKTEMQRASQWLVDKLSEIGLQHAQAIPTASFPVVYADWLNAGSEAPTLLIYGHYDVQPVDPVEEWLTPPFEPTVKGDDIYCRARMYNET